jgi:hypothetical protein
MSIESKLPIDLRAHIYSYLSFKDLKRRKGDEAANMVLAVRYEEIKQMPEGSFLNRIARQVDELPTSNQIKMRMVYDRAFSTMGEALPHPPFPDS